MPRHAADRQTGTQLPLHTQKNYVGEEALKVLKNLKYYYNYFFKVESILEWHLLAVKNMRVFVKKTDFSSIQTF